MKQYIEYLATLLKGTIERIDNWPEVLAAFAEEMRGRIPPKELVLRIKGGPELEIPNGGTSLFYVVFPEIFINNVYEPDGIVISPKSVIVDLGANVGFFTCKIAQQRKEARIIAVEAMAENCEILRRNIQRNSFKNITVVNSAIAGSIGSIDIPFYYTPTGECRVTSATPADTDIHNAKIPTTTVEEIFSKHSIDRCNLLKIDIEGHEYATIYSTPDAVLSRIDQIAMEWHNEPARGNPAELSAFLSGKGFQILPASDKDFTAAAGMLYAVRR